MASFQKPENALKRAEELIEIGKKQDAIDTLHLAIHHRKWRNNWSTVIEQIMIRHLDLCVELKKIRMAREDLYQYRSMCQAANIGSLELVVRRFREAAEGKVNEAQKEQNAKMAEIDDLDEMEAPQTILLRAIQAHDTRQQSQDRDVHAHFRFLWDAYRLVLDVLKFNVRLEGVYHETAQRAFEFCRSNKRPQEFKRLCDTLRKNFQDLSKRTGPINQHQVNPSNPDTIIRTIDTRFAQLNTATELDLWREAYNTATEVCELMNKAKTKPKTRSEYFEYLGQIFWKSENYLFHGFACLKNVLFVKAVKRDLSKDDLQLMASKAVMATLCVPFQKSNDIHASMELATEGQFSPHEKAKHHSTLFNAQSVPTRDTIIGQLVEKNLLQYAAEPVQRLFALIESDFTPLTLCQDAKPFLDQISSDENSESAVCGGKLDQYVTPVKKIIFFRLMKQLSEVYANMTIENFERAASIVPFSIAEKWMANAARQQGINIQINYRDQAIVFGASRKLDMKSMRQPLIEIGHKLQQAMQRVAPEEQNKKGKLDKATLSQNIDRRVDEERSLIRQRREEIERRKEADERQKEQAAKEAMEKIKKQEAKEAEAERVRLLEERTKRDAEREEQKRKDAKIKETKEMLDQMKKQDESKPTNLKIGGKKIGDIQAEDIADISFAQIEKAREAQLTRERQEKIRQRKLESKRVDHLARSFREEEMSKLGDWAEDTAAADNEFLDGACERDEKDQRALHDAAIVEKTVLIVFQEAKDKWVEEKLEEKHEAHVIKMKEQRSALLQKEVENKIERARKRKQAHEHEQSKKADDKKREEQRLAQEALEEKRRVREEREAAEREEEEAAEREEEETRMKEQKEARESKRKEEDEMRKRVEQKQRDREKEIEERNAAGGRNAPAKEEAPARGGGGGGWRDREAAREAPAPRGGRDAPADRDGDWGRGGRDAPAARDAPADKGGDNWRREAPAARDEPPAAAPGERPRMNLKPRTAPAPKAGTDQPWRKQAEPEKKPEEEPAQEAAAPAKPKPWGARKAAEPEADVEEAPAPAKKKEAPAPEPVEEEKKADDEDGGGWDVAVSSKKKKKSAAPAEEAAAAVKSAPWKRSPAPGAEEAKSSSRDDWKSKGKEAGGDATPGGSAARPWNRK